MPIETAKLLGGVATNKEVAPSKRAFDTGILLLSYAVMRFSDAQRLGASKRPRIRPAVPFSSERRRNIMALIGLGRGHVWE